MREKENKIMYKLIIPNEKVLEGYVPSDEYDYNRRIDCIIHYSNKWYLVNEPKLKGFGIYVDFRHYGDNEELFYLYCSKTNIRSKLHHYMGLNKEDIKILEKYSEIIQLSFWESCNLIVKKTILTQYFYLKCKLRNEIYYLKFTLQKKINIAKKTNLTLVSIIIQLITLFFILLLLKGV